MIFHLDPGTLRRRALEPAEREHLAACPRCRVAVRLQSAFDPDEAAPELPTERYVDLGLLGRGGMGEVRRVFDRVLAREVALKLLPALDDPERRARFEREARLTAGLQHPGIAPVLDAGTLPDGRPWYTMRVVTGETLAAVLAARPEPVRLEEPATRRLVELVLRAAEAVGYAHHQGVVHRDLKPANLMRGALGEVAVLDWGLARRVGGAPARAGEGSAGEDHGQLTRDGVVAGTLSYMAPEQACAEGAAIAPTMDAWALGAVLREVAGGGRIHGDARGAELLERARRGIPAPLPVSLPAELVEILDRALQADPRDRYPDAAAFAQHLQAWLDGAWRRARALGHVEASARALARAEALRDEVERHLAAARAALEEVRPHEPVDRKRAAWAAEDTAHTLRVEVEEAELESVEELRAALAVSPGLPEARERLAALYVERHAAAEAARDDARAAFLARQLREVDPARWQALTRGGKVEVTSDPPGALVFARPYERRDRRLVPCASRPLGATPLLAELPAGSWLLELHHAGRVQPLPVVVTRDATTRALRPGAAAPTPVPLALPLGPDDCLVAAGWFLAGGDPEATSALPARRLWADAFVLRRHPVTNAEYLAFLDDLVVRGREDEALAHAPRERPGTFGAPGALIYGRRADGGFELVPDAEGDRWAADWPVVNVTFDGARAYADWLAARDGLPWRLPTELEWEKAARGADGRAFPWGDFLDPTWANVREGHAGRPLPTPVGGYPVDESPWGVRGLAGNVRDRCLDLLRDGPRVDGAIVVVDAPSGAGTRTLKGGSFGDVAVVGRAATRTGVAPDLRGGRIGFRLARSV